MSYVQSAGHGQATSTTNSLAFSSNNTAGNLLVLGSINDGAGPTITSVSDTQGNTWSKAISGLHQFNTKDSEIWYTPNCKAGANTVTVTYSGSVDSIIIIGEYSGVITSSPLDQTVFGASPDGVASTAVDSGATGTTTQASELFVGFAGVGGSNGGPFTFTPGTNFTGRLNIQGGTTYALALEDRTLNSTGTYDVTATLNVAAQWSALGATFKLAPTTSVKQQSMSQWSWSI